MPSVLSLFAVRLPPRACVALSAFFAPLVVGPSLLRCRDVLLLAALGTSRQQNHEPVAVLAEIDPVSWPEIDPEFLDPCPDALDVGKVAKLDARQRDRDRDRDLRGGLSIEALNQARYGLSPSASRYS